MGRETPAPPRRVEALAYIIERIQRFRSCPTYAEIGRAMRPPINGTRVRQLVDQLIASGLIERDPGAQRGIRIRDLDRCRAVIETELGARGWSHARPLGVLEAPDPCSIAQLSVMPPFLHLPEPDLFREHP